MTCKPEAERCIARGEAFEKRGAFHDAVREYRRAIVIDDTCAAAHAAWGNALQERGRHREAVARYTDALHQDPTLHAVWERLGEALFAIGSHMPEIDRRPEIDRVNRMVQQLASADAWARWGALADPLGAPTIAEAAYRNALATAETADNYLGLARALEAQHRPAATWAALEQALDRSPEDPDVFAILSRSLKSALYGDEAEPAKTALTRLSEVMTRIDAVAAQVNWAGVLRELGHHDTAVEVLQRAADRSPLRADGYATWAASLVALDRRDDAVAVLRHALERVKQADELYLFASDLPGLSDEHLATLEQRADQLKSAPAFLTLAHFLNDLKRPEAALRVLEAAALVAPASADVRFYLARELAVSERHEAALRQCLEAIAAEPERRLHLLDNAEMLRVELGVLLRDASPPNEARYFSMVQAVVDRLNRAVIYMKWGAALLDLERIVYALQQLDKAAALGPADAELLLHQAHALARIGERAAAVAKCVAAIRLAPKGDWRGLAATLLSSAAGVQQDAMVSAVQEAVEARGDADAVLAWARVLQQTGRLEPALTQYRQVAAMRPDDTAHHGAAEVLAALGRFEEAIGDALIGLEVMPDNWVDLSVIGRALNGLEDETAQVQRVQAVVDRLDRAWLYHMWARVLFSVQRHTEAANQLRRAIGLGETSVQTRLDLAVAYEQLERYDDAIAQYQAAQAAAAGEEPLLSEIHRRWGVNLRNKGQPALAVDHFKRATKTAWVRFNWALSLEKLNDYRGAVDMYREAIAAADIDDTVRAYATHNIAVVRLRQGDYRSARAAWKTARTFYETGAGKAIQDRNADYFLYYGWASDNVEGSDDVEVFPTVAGCYRQALAFNPKHTETLTSMVKFCRTRARQQGKDAAVGETTGDAEDGARAIHWMGLDAYHRARRILTARADREKTMRSIVDLALLHLATEEYDEAAKVFRRAIEQDHPLLGAVHEGLGVVSVRRRRFKEGIDHFRRARERDPNNFDLWSNLAEAYLKADQLERAEVEYKALLDIAPGHIDALVGLGQVYVALGDAAHQAGRAADAEDMFSRAIDQLTRALQPADADELSKKLAPGDRSAALYARGYARVKLFEAQSALKQREVTDYLENARADFREVGEDHENYHKARRAIRKVDERLKPQLRLAEEWGPRLLFAIVFLVFLAAQAVFFAGYETRHDAFRFSEADVERMRADGLPEEAAKKIRTLGAERFGSQGEASAQARKALGDVSAKLEPIVMKHVSPVRIGSRMLEAPSYVTLTFGSLVFMVAALYLQQISKLKFGAIELEKSSGDLIRTSTSLGIGR